MLVLGGLLFRLVTQKILEHEAILTNVCQSGVFNLSLVMNMAFHTEALVATKTYSRSPGRCIVGFIGGE